MGLHASFLPGHLSQFAPSRLTRASLEVGLGLSVFGDFLGNYRFISFFLPLLPSLPFPLSPGGDKPYSPLEPVALLSCLQLYK